MGSFRNQYRIHVLLLQLIFFAIVCLLVYTLWTRNISNHGHYSVNDELNSIDSLVNARNDVEIDVNTKTQPTSDLHEDLLNQLSQLLSANSDFPTNLNSLHQGSPLLHKYILFRHLTPPSKEPYNLPGSPNAEYMNSYSQAVGKLFKGKVNGTFIEAGAYDGVAASNTIYLEKMLGWNGLLVECNPMTVPYLKTKKRKAWVADVCLSQTQYPATVNFSNPTKWAPSAKIGDPVDLTKWGVKTDWTHFQVPSIPLFALLSTINMVEIDFFSLDVEGAEFDVLKSIPWDKVKITAIFLEVNHFSAEIKKDIQAFLESKEYALYEDYDSDQLYVHTSFKI